MTVLFGDLSDFTAWAEGVDPERVGAVTDRVLAALAGAVKTFGGHVDKLTGDGIMAVFGAPVAHEDDPERAVRAALAMQRAVRRVLDDERGGGAPAGLRIGVNTGEVVAGVQAALEYTVIGDTVNTAARLADAAVVGTVYAGAATSAATRHVVSWRRLLPLRLKGKRAAGRGVRAARPAGRARYPVRPGRRGRRSSGGRRSWRWWPAGWPRSVDRGEPQVLVFTAEAGLGKSRLAAEAARFAAGLRPRGTGGARVLSVRCAAYGERWRLGPLADLVRAAIGLPDQPGAAATRAVAEERLRRAGQIGRAPHRRRAAAADRATAGAAGLRRAVGRPGRPRPASRRRPARRDADAGGDAGRPRWPSCSRRWPPRRRWWSSSTTCTTPPPETVDALGATLEPARPGRCWWCCWAGPSWSAPPAR